MKILQAVLSRAGQSRDEVGARLAPLAAIDPHLVLVFGDVSFFATSELADTLATMFPEATRAGCSTAGEISGEGVTERSCVITAVLFDHGSLKGASAPLPTMDASFAAGQAIARGLEGAGLKAALLFGRGVEVNGSALLRGVIEVLGESVALGGGLAGDGVAFRRTYTLDNDGVSDCRVVAVGFYGERMAIGRGSYGGWEAFGPARKVTRSSGNVLAELDGEPALAIYKRYLGDHARDLPGSGLLFPFLMLDGKEAGRGLVRTILGVDDALGTLTLAGEIETGGYLKLMHSSTDQLVDGAETAARETRRAADPQGESLAVLVSCVGRKLVMGARVDEEVEAVAAVLNAGAVLTGFYSYGEFGPVAAATECLLHNQTMTVMHIGEA